MKIKENKTNIEFKMCSLFSHNPSHIQSQTQTEAKWAERRSQLGRQRSVQWDCWTANTSDVQIVYELNRFTA